METRQITGLEATRLDDLTAYNAVLLACFSGNELDTVLGSEMKRYGRSDVAYRNHVLSNMHPDDLIVILVYKGYSLSSFGIESIKRDQNATSR